MRLNEFIYVCANRNIFMSNESDEPVEFVRERDVMGLELETNSQQTESALETNAVSENTSQPYSDYQSVSRFVALYVLSLGTYQLYWYYHHWDNIRNKTGETFNPALRTLFVVIFGYPFFRRVKKMAREKGYKANAPMLLLFVLYVAAASFGYIFSLISLLNFIFLIPVLHALNFYYIAEQPDRKIRKGFSPNELLFLIIITSINLLLLFIYTD
jgi:hypothetical protein